MTDYNIIIKWLNFELKYKNVSWSWGLFNLGHTCAFNMQELWSGRERERSFGVGGGVMWTR